MSKLSDRYKNGAKCTFYKHKHTNRKITGTRCLIHLDFLSGCILDIYTTSKYNRKCKTLSSLGKSNKFVPLPKVECDNKIYKERVKPLSFGRNKNIIF